MKTALFALLAVLFFPLHAFCAEKNGSSGSMPAKIRMTFGHHEVVVSMFDSPASRDFLSLLPLEAEFKDYAGEEKITYLPRKLNTTGSPDPSESRGDFTYYRPWGNLAVFYHGFGSSGQLTVLGRIESGKDKLASMTGNFMARIEVIPIGNHELE